MQELKMSIAERRMWADILERHGDLGVSMEGDPARRLLSDVETLAAEVERLKGLLSGVPSSAPEE